VGRILALALLAAGIAVVPAGAPPAQAAATKPDNLCLTCPRPEPACWLTVYRWEDYNLRAGDGTTVIVTDGPPPSEADKERARMSILRDLPSGHKIAIGKSSRINCPPGARAGE